MEKFKNFVIFLIVFGFAFFAISCGDGGDEPEPNTPDTPAVPNDPDDGEIKCKVISKIELEKRYPSGSTFSPDVIFSSPKYEYNKWWDFYLLNSYNDGSISFSCSYDFPYSISQTLRNSDGPLINYDIVYEIDQISHLVSKEHLSDIVHHDSAEYEYKYDNKRRLIQVIYPSGKSTDIAYDDFDISRIRTYMDGIYYLEYYDIVAKHIPIQYFNETTTHYVPLLYASQMILESGWMGNSIPLHLIKTVKCDGGGEEYNYKYKFDKDGYVTEMIEEKWTDTGTYINTYKIEWTETDNCTYINWLFNDIGSPYYKYM
ncbi:MAG: hypothetical protein NC102_08540 [Clostridium sp.]|nr:hypothetical protein [Clostridium sp.]